MMTLTESATAKLQDLIAEEGNPELKLRVFVQGGGCSGMQSGFTFDESANEDDWDLEFGGVKVLVDSMSSQYLTGATSCYSPSRSARPSRSCRRPCPSAGMATFST